MTLTHCGSLPPKITMTLFNDTSERDDYHIRNDEFIVSFVASSIYLCVAFVVTHLFNVKMGLIFGNDIKLLHPNLVNKMSYLAE